VTVASSRRGKPASRRSRYPIVAVRAPRVIAKLPKDVHAQTVDYTAWWRAATSPAAAVEPACDRLRVAHGRAATALRTQMLVSFVAQGLFDRLGKLA
jgi:pyruvate,water dikinase